MDLFAYCFKPISRERIGLCLSVILLCLCLLPAHAQEFDTEFWRRVPDVRGLTVEKAREVVNAKGIRTLDISYEGQSRKPKDTISRQEPNPGELLNITRPLKVWVSKPAENDIRVIGPLPLQEPEREPVKADIFPRECVVKQGETAFFASRATPREGISETWSGPGNQQGSGANFEVRTGGLEPGSYDVDLMVTYGRRQRDRARATLTVTEAPVPPQQPGGGGESGTGEPRLHYSATISSDTPEARRLQPVTFTAELSPGRRYARFRFDFGDGTRVETQDVTVTHAYETAGTFEAFVQVLDRRGEFVVESDRIEIAVHGAPVQQGEGGGAQGQPPSPHNKWLWIGIALLGGIAASYVLISRTGRSSPPVDPGTRLRVEPRGDPGSQDMEGDMARLVGPEICLVPISDMGEQAITEEQKPFVREERWENE